MSHIDIEHLAHLSRIKLTPSEVEKLEGEMESILSYVAEIQNAPVDLEALPEKEEPRNILREDAAPYERGTFKERLLREAPDTEGGFIKVKKIL